MNRQRNIFKALSFGLMLILPCTSFSSAETGETVIKRGTVSDDFYTAGGTVDMDADVNGDAVIAGGDLFIGSRIQGDVMAAGGSINIRGEVLDDVRIAGGDINIDAVIGDDLIAAGGKIRFSSASSTGGEAWLAGGDVLVAGTIDKNLFIGAGNIRISGTIHGDVEIQGEKIQILEGAIIKGNLHYKSPSEAKIHPDATISGKVTYEPIEWDYQDRSFGIFFSLTLVVASVVLFLLFPGFTMSSAGRISRDPWKSLGIGFALLIFVPMAAVLLMSIVLGIWVGLSILAFYFVALITGLLVSCFFLGDLGARLLHKDVSTTGRRFLSVTVAIILLGLIQLTPVIGGLVTFLLILSGLGASGLQIHFIYNQSNGAKSSI